MPSFTQQVMGGLAISMKKNRTAVTGLLLFMTVVLLGSTIYISTLLSSPNNSPTQIQKSKAAPITYKKTIDLAQFDATAPTPNISASPIPSISTTPMPTLLAKAPTIPPPTAKPTAIPTKSVTAVPTLLAKAPTLPPPTIAPTKIVAAVEPTDIPEIITPTLQPLLAYKSTSVTPTLIPIKDGTGGMANPTTAAKSTPSPTKKITPTGVQTLPETGWVQTSSILFIVATTTILFSLLF